MRNLMSEKYKKYNYLFGKKEKELFLQQPDDTIMRMNSLSHLTPSTVCVLAISRSFFPGKCSWLHGCCVQETRPQNAIR